MASRAIAPDAVSWACSSLSEPQATAEAGIAAIASVKAVGRIRPAFLAARLIG